MIAHQMERREHFGDLTTIVCTCGETFESDRSARAFEDYHDHAEEENARDRENASADESTARPADVQEGPGDVSPPSPRPGPSSLAEAVALVVRTEGTYQFVRGLHNEGRLDDDDLVQAWRQMELAKEEARLLLMGREL